MPSLSRLEIHLPRRFAIAFAVLTVVLASPWAAVAFAVQDHIQMCSGGLREGKSCASNSDCELGVCVNAKGVCDGGSDDGFSCPCPGSTCSAATPCADQPRAGTCAGGPLAGSCCSLEFGCSDGKPCVASQKVCVGGRFKGASCLRDSHCPDSTCQSTGLACDAGIYEDSACADNADCPRSTCSSPNRAPTCAGDCNGSNDVTVDELIVMVNVALGSAQLTICTAADSNRDAQVTVDEILAAVSVALRGCLAATPTPSL